VNDVPPHLHRGIFAILLQCRSLGTAQEQDYGIERAMNGNRLIQSMIDGECVLGLSDFEVPKAPERANAWLRSRVPHADEPICPFLRVGTHPHESQIFWNCPT